MRAIIPKLILALVVLLLVGFALFVETHRPSREACASACTDRGYPQAQPLIGLDEKECRCIRESTHKTENLYTITEKLEITLP